jgi:pSer/pThr/pTyr-binding forkhead associated (FHA) protein
MGGVPVPLAHPALCSMIMSPGQLQVQRGQVVVGRDAARASLVITHGAVSGQHATVMLDRMMAVDHGSTSGTWVGGRQLPANQPTPIDPNGVIAFGPVPVPVGLLGQIAQGAMAGAPVAQAAPIGPGTSGQPAAAHAPGGAPAGGGGEAGGAPRKHRTVIGELSLDQLQNNLITIGRTPDNQIVVNHAQVSSKHAQITKVGDQLFLEDRGSANGTFVRGQRLAPNQRVPVARCPWSSTSRRAGSTSWSRTRPRGPASRSTRSRPGTFCSTCPTATTRVR